MAVTGGAYAQTADDATRGKDELAEVVVTGSRLQVAGFNAPTPVTVVDAATIQQRAPSNIADILNEQPAFRVSSADTSRNNGPFPNNAQATLDLRNLGPLRTLTLINGRRVVGTNWQGTVDSNIIPVGLVERVEVVTGGASAAYGSDAVAGVANIILRNNLQGVTANLQGGVSQYGSSKQLTAGLAGGTAFADGRGHVIAGLDYNKSDAIPDAYGKAWGAAEIATVQPSAAQRAALNLPQNVILTNVEPGTSAPGGLLYQGTATGRAYTFDSSGNPVLFNQGTIWGTGQNMSGSTANYGYSQGNAQPLRLQTSRVDAYGRVSYELTDSVSGFVEANISRNKVPTYKTADHITAVGAGGTTPAITVARTNSFVTAATLALLSPGTAPFTIGRINTELGGYDASQQIDSHRVVLGFDGKFAGDWKWDAYYQSGRSRLDLQRNDLMIPALQKAVNGCTDITTGLTAQQRTDITTWEAVTGKSCVPFNPFGVGRNPASATSYWVNNTRQVDNIEQDVVAATVSGSPVKLPAGDLAVAAGAEYRREYISADSDNVSELGTILASNLVQFFGGYHVKEGFVELGVPVVKDLPFVKSLDLNAAARRTDYSLSGAVTTWKAGLTWDLNDALRARFTRSRDIRAPNPFEIFLVGGQGNATAINRIANGVVGRNGSVNVNPLGTANTVSQGIIQVGSGGGANVKPEIGDTITGGLVFQRGGLRTSLDYYQVVLSGAISRPSNQQEIDLCRDGDASHCQNIVFDSTVPGGIKLVEARSTNLNKQSVFGYDFEIGYSHPMFFGLPGQFNVRGLVNYVMHDRAYNVLTFLSTENANTFASLPTLGYNVNLGYDVGRLQVNVQVRGFGRRRGNSITYNPDGTINAANTILGPEDPGYVVTNNQTINQNRFAGQYLINPSVNYKFSDRISAFLNIDNLFDVNPPALTINPAYDLIGRRYRAGVRAQF